MRVIRATLFITLRVHFQRSSSVTVEFLPIQVVRNLSSKRKQLDDRLKLTQLLKKFVSFIDASAIALKTIRQRADQLSDADYKVWLYPQLELVRQQLETQRSMEAVDLQIKSPNLFYAVY